MDLITTLSLYKPVILVHSTCLSKIEISTCLSNWENTRKCTDILHAFLTRNDLEERMSDQTNKQ